MAAINLGKIRELRTQKKLTQKQMAEKLGYKTSLGYHYLETGRCQIKAEQLMVIASELGINVEDLYAYNTTEMVT